MHTVSIPEWLDIVCDRIDQGLSSWIWPRAPIFLPELSPFLCADTDFVRLRRGLLLWLLEGETYGVIHCTPKNWRDPIRETAELHRQALAGKDVDNERWGSIWGKVAVTHLYPTAAVDAAWKTAAEATDFAFHRKHEHDSVSVGLAARWAAVAFAVQHPDSDSSFGTFVRLDADYAETFARQRTSYKTFWELMSKMLIQLCKERS